MSAPSSWGWSDIAEHLTPTEVHRLLDEHGLAPRRAEGQHFVVDGNTLDKIVREARLKRGDTVLEIGPGLGSLTVPLAREVRRVVAVEIDAGLIEVLRERIADREEVELVHGDAMELAWSSLADGPLRLVANLPYNLATALVLKAVREPAVRDAFVMVQQEVGERWAAAPGESAYGAPTAKLALLADAELAFSVSRNAFLPPPRVDSCMVRVLPRRAGIAPAEVDAVWEVIDAAFAQRRKTIRNSIGALAGKDAVVAACRAVGIAPRRRAERLSAEDFRRLTAALGRA